MHGCYRKSQVLSSIARGAQAESDLNAATAMLEKPENADAANFLSTISPIW
eukprot:SAG31_NODE_4081_length_3608_cov_3.369336_3_plen_51_part_00